MISNILGGIVVTVAHLICTQIVGVRLPLSPPFAPQESADKRPSNGSIALPSHDPLLENVKQISEEYYTRRRVEESI